MQNTSCYCKILTPVQNTVCKCKILVPVQNTGFSAQKYLQQCKILATSAKYCPTRSADRFKSSRGEIPSAGSKVILSHPRKFLSHLKPAVSGQDQIEQPYHKWTKILDQKKIMDLDGIKLDQSPFYLCWSKLRKLGRKSERRFGHDLIVKQFPPKISIQPQYQDWRPS